ncbi:RHS repeat-associated core domain-containing protein [Streptomyces sp. NPDC096030]|uniref:RHS repeat-associated core domain-containing protein n=1 Tax=Streptomyces sp. NPDC096030 TaxID=3155423 RepID=UPI0033315827
MTSLPLVSLPGRGGAGVELALVYDQDAAGAGTDRSGLGQGFGLGKAYVDPADGGTLHTAGGSFRVRPGDSAGPGLERYLLNDLAFRERPGSLPEREGLDLPRDYRWVLASGDGRKSYFSAEGDLIAEEDRFGHQSAYEWELAGGEQHRLVRAVDAYGQAVTFDYSTEGEVAVTSPVRSDGIRPRITLHLEEGRLVRVAYPEDRAVRLAWDYVPQGLPGRLLSGMETPAGAVTRVAYSEPHGFPVASSLKVTDGDGKSLTAERTFRLDPEGEQAGHDFTGRGQYASAGELFDSADSGYRYATELSDGRSTVRSVFNSLHLLKERTAFLHVQGELKPVRTQELQYEGEREDGTLPAASDLPANYGKPVRASVTVHDPATGRKRTTTETARFDGYGRETERTDVTGARTVTEYDRSALDTAGGSEGGAAGYGLPLRTTVTGADGAQSVTENTLSADRRSVTGTRQLVKNAGEAGLSARTVTACRVGGDGEITAKKVTWAEGARPGGAEGPQEVSETYAAAVDAGARTRTVTVTDAAGSASQTTDLVTGQVVKAVDADGRTAETAYDEAGRVIAEKVPGGPRGGGLVTSTSYSRTATTVTAPGQGGEKHVTVHERDLLGRVVKSTDNVSGGRLTGDPAARTLHTVTFEDDGRVAKVTDRAGLMTLTAYDEAGRPVRTVAPNGMTQLTVYADAATADTATVTTLTLPAGETDPARAVAARTETFDSLERPVASAVSFSDGTQQTGSSQSYDSLGRISGSAAADLTVTTAYTSGGTPGATTLTPEKPGTFPGQKTTAVSPRDLTGAPVVKTLTAGTGEDGERRQGTAMVRDGAGRITEERRPDGKKTAFAYTPGGQVKETLSPGGTRTSYRYDQAGQLLEKVSVSADGKTTEKTGYTYDPHTGAVTAVYDPDDAGGTRISYTYDADGNTTCVTYPGGRTVRQEYGDSGQLRKMTDTAGLSTFYTYHPDGTLAAAVQRASAADDSEVKASVAYTYDGLGRITAVDRGNGVVTAVTYTHASQTRSEKTTRSGEPVSAAAYTYDSHGNLTERTDTRPAAGADGAPGKPVTTTTRYGYDAYNRLISSGVYGEDGQQQTAVRYTLNVAGDITETETTPYSGGKPQPGTVTAHSTDTSGRLTALTTGGREHTQTFDDEGNLTTRHDGTRYTYNLQGQPVTATAPGGSTTRYTYWADGTRATETLTATPSGTATPGRTTTFHYSPDGTLLNDTHTSTDGSDSTAAASYLLAGTRQARVLTGPGAQQAAAAGSGYLITDRHGSTTALTGSQGEVTQAWNYTDYGQHASPAGTPHTSTGGSPAGAARQPFTFAGQYTSTDATQYLKTRVYDTTTGRFTTPDPAPQFNRYQAMGTNPVTHTDPDGTTETPDWQYLVLGATVLAGIVTNAITLLAATGPLAAGFTVIGAALGLASDLVSIAALHSGQDKPSDPLGIATLTLAAAGIAAGITSSLASGIIAARASAQIAEETAETVIEEHIKKARLIFGDLLHIEDDAADVAHRHLSVLGSLPEEDLTMLADAMHAQRTAPGKHTPGIYITANKAPSAWDDAGRQMLLNDDPHTGATWGTPPSESSLYVMGRFMASHQKSTGISLEAATQPWYNRVGKKAAAHFNKTTGMLPANKNLVRGAINNRSLFAAELYSFLHSPSKPTKFLGSASAAQEARKMMKEVLTANLS